MTDADLESDLVAQNFHHCQDYQDYGVQGPGFARQHELDPAAKRNTKEAGPVAPSTRYDWSRGYSPKALVSLVRTRFVSGANCFAPRRRSV